MKYINVIIFLTIFSNLTHGQQNGDPTVFYSTGYDGTSKQKFVSEESQAPDFLVHKNSGVAVKLDDIQGSPYLYDAYLPGSIYDIKYQQKQDVFIRFNIYNENFEVKKEGFSDAPVSILLKNPDFSAQIGEKIFYLKEVEDRDGNLREVYVEDVKQYDQFSLFKEHVRILKEAKPAKTSLEGDIPAKIKNFENYFLARNGSVKEIEMNKKKVIESMGWTKLDIKSFIKKNRLKFNDEDDLILLLDFISANDN